MRAVIKIVLIFFSFFLLKGFPGFSQEGYDLKVEKPKKYENRALGFEKTYTKKYKGPRKFIQSTITHYNYFYNANLKLQNVLKQAKDGHRDDYTQLLPFYNYDLNTTAASKTELDSVIYKATAGIVLHDLRNEWIDNMYMLIGQAYFLRNDLDSAAVSFQFINQAFAPREKDGYEKVIASNATEGGDAFHIVTEENNSIAKRALSEPPSRNEALIWMIRTAIERNSMAEASSLLQALYMDPDFPERLAPHLAQMKALYFYKNNVPDSAAFFLEKALPSAENTTESARWKFLMAQLYEKAGQKENAISWYNAAIRSTLDPVMDIYARLNAIRLNKEGGDDYIVENIEALYKMGRKDNYALYRDIIYYTAGMMDKERTYAPGIIQSMQRSVRFNNNNPSVRNKAFEQLGNAYFQSGMFVEAKSAYDSIMLEDPSLDSVDQITARKEALSVLVQNLAVMQRQDSLQTIARMPEAEREKLLQDMVKLHEKSSKKKFAGLANTERVEDGPADLFDTNARGEWYFYNNGLKGKGATDFKNRWGDRPNVDNWRRVLAIDKNAPVAIQEESMIPEDSAASVFSYENLLANIPLTPEQMSLSNDSIREAMFNVAMAYQASLEDYAKAAEGYEALLARFPGTDQKPAIYFNLYFCYWKLGLTDRAQRYKNVMLSEFPGTPLSQKLMDPDKIKNSPQTKEKEATALYETIYNKFIEGDFQNALNMKQKADSQYGKIYWTPQLLYIEAVYHIKQRNDAAAIRQLDAITANFMASPMVPKAQNLKNVLKRRNEIETYLANLEIERNEDEPRKAIAALEPASAEEEALNAAKINAAKIQNETSLLSEKNMALKTESSLRAPVTPDSILQMYKEVETARAVRTDSSKLAIARADIPSEKEITLKESNLRAPVTPDSVLEKYKEVDTATAKNILSPDKETIRPGIAAQKELTLKESNLRAPVTPDSVLEKYREVETAAARKVDSVQRERTRPELTARESIKTDKLPGTKAVAQFTKNGFVHTPKEKHVVLLVLHKVDPVYVSEARNAFARYNRESYSEQRIALQNETLSDSVRLLSFQGFTDLNTASDYVEKARERAGLEIIPWLPANKYSFVVISEANLPKLLETQQLEPYLDFWKDAVKLK